MANIIDLDNFGKRIASDFISDNVNMTSALHKVASTHGLNKQQINRVAETANVESYLSLMKTANDKYLSFPVADATLVNTSLTKKANNANNISAYNDAPSSDISVSALFGAYKEAEWSSPVVIDGQTLQVSICKTAEAILVDKDLSVEDKVTQLSDRCLIKEAEKEIKFTRKGKKYTMMSNKETMAIMSNKNIDAFSVLQSKGLVKEALSMKISNASGINKAANEHRGAISLVKNEYHVHSGKALSAIDSLYYQCKQACLSGNTPNEVIKVINTASPILGEDLSNLVLTKLASDAPHLDLSVSDVVEVVNESSIIYKTAKLVESEVVITTKLDSALTKLHEKYANFTADNDIPNSLKHARDDEFLPEIIKTAIKKVKVTPYLATFQRVRY